MNWGKGIALSFILFAGIILTMVFISMRQEVNLVSEDYYQNEIEYENRIDQIRNTVELENTPEIVLDRPNERILIQFPAELSNCVREGRIVLFRPSDSKDDFEVQLNLNEDHLQMISMKGRKHGLWQVMLHWNTDEKSFYDEKNIHL